MAEKLGASLVAAMAESWAEPTGQWWAALLAVCSAARSVDPLVCKTAARRAAQMVARTDEKRAD